MNLFRIAVTAAAAAVLTFVGASAYAQAQNTTQAPQLADQNALSSVGGSPAPQTEAGAPMGKTREQVYRELIDSRNNGEWQRMQDLYRGGN